MSPPHRPQKGAVGCGGAALALCSPLGSPGPGTGVQGFPLVRPPVVHAGVEGDALLLPEAPPVRRTLLRSERESKRERERRLQEELGPTKAFLSRLSRKWLRPGWGGLSFSLSPTRFLEGAGGNRKGCCRPSNAYMRWPSWCSGQGPSTSPPPQPPPQRHWGAEGAPGLGCAGAAPHSPAAQGRGGRPGGGGQPVTPGG